MNEQGTTESYEKLAEQYMREKRYGEAIEIYKKLADMNPGEDSFVFALAMAYRDGGMPEEAIACLEGLLDRELQRRVFTGFAFDELVRIYRQDRQHDKLVHVCERVVQVQREDPALLFTMGDSYLRAGRYREAVEIFKKLLEMEPDSYLYASCLGQAFIAAGDFGKAKEAYDRCVSIDPADTAGTLHRMGMVYAQYGHLEKAERTLAEAIDGRPDDPLYRCDLGEVLVRAGKTAEAFAAYGEAARMSPAFAGAYWNRLGNTLMKEKRPRDAVDAFRKAAEHDPANPFYRLRLAEAYAAGGLEDLARAVLEGLTNRGGNT